MAKHIKEPGYAVVPIFCAGLARGAALIDTAARKLRKAVRRVQGWLSHLLRDAGIIQLQRVANAEYHMLHDFASRPAPAYGTATEFRLGSCTSSGMRSQP